MALSSEIQARLRSISTLPSPPQVAMKIIELAQDPEPDLPATARAISKDPALTAKILRVANSPLYARRRRCDNLRQALLVLGLNATLTLALSFSLSSAIRGGRSKHLDFDRGWRRSLLSGVVSRVIARHLSCIETEEYFLAALLQDIGMLALDKAYPETYETQTGLPSDHLQLAALEQEKLGADHAAVGAWLLRSWQMPDALCTAVEWSHDPDGMPADDPLRPLVSAVALAGQIADMWLTDGGTHRSCEVADLGKSWLGLSREALSDLLEEVHAEIAEAESTYETSIINKGEAEAILEQARDILLVRNLQALNEVTELRATAESLESRAQELEEANRRDTLTGTYTKAFFIERLEEEFRAAREGGWPFTVMFADLDFFKKINDTHGHLVGDRVLVSVAGLLRRATRPSDIVARYGGEEFVVILPGNDRDSAVVVANRLIESFRNTRHRADDDLTISVTVSIGLATLDMRANFATHVEMLEAADKAVYQAKMSGRDRFCIYGEATQPTPEPAEA